MRAGQRFIRRRWDAMLWGKSCGARLSSRAPLGVRAIGIIRAIGGLFWALLAPFLGLGDPASPSPPFEIAENTTLCTAFLPPPLGEGRKTISWAFALTPPPFSSPRPARGEREAGFSHAEDCDAADFSLPFRGKARWRGGQGAERRSAPWYPSRFSSPLLLKRSCRRPAANHAIGVSRSAWWYPDCDGPFGRQ